MNETLINILLGVALLAALGLNIYVRMRRQFKSPLGKAALIAMDLNRSNKSIETFGQTRGVPKLKTGNWRKQKDKVDFLPHEIRMELSDVFEMIDEVNASLGAAKRFHSDSYLAGIDVSKLKEPLARARANLQDWIQENMHNPEYQPKKRRSLLSFFNN